MAIYFHKEDTSFNLKHKIKLKNWVVKCIEENQKVCGDINYIFCSDEYLLSINKSYLDHHYYTDIITFDNSENETKINSDIFISVDRVVENAKSMNISFEDELHRVMIHGILHLLGWGDKTTDQAEKMRKLEDNCLKILKL